MEDCATLASDCIVISCCCQCLILQMIVFILLKLPHKLVHKAKQYYAKIKKLRQLRKRAKMIIERQWRSEYFLAVHGGSKRVDQLGGFDEIEMDDDCGNCCMEDVEKVLEELSHKGEFAFGSFWGRERSSGGSLSGSVAKQEFDFNVVQFHLIEVGSAN